jgi:hypothetical protein
LSKNYLTKKTGKGELFLDYRPGKGILFKPYMHPLCQASTISDADIPDAVQRCSGYTQGQTLLSFHAVGYARIV